MSLPPDLALAEVALDRLERLEVRVLVWGLVDSALSAPEVEDTLSTSTLSDDHLINLIDGSWA